MEKEQVIVKIHEKFPNWNFIVKEYSKNTAPICVLCLDCNQETSYKNLYSLLYKKSPCICQSKHSKNKTLYYRKEIQKFLNSQNVLKFIDFISVNNKPGVSIFCSQCENTFSQRLITFYQNKKCPHCSFRGMPTNKVIENRLKEYGYEMLSPYQGSHEKILVRHNKCGYTWWVAMNVISNFQESCPYCNRQISKGERKIIIFLQEHQIVFQKEKRFAWQSHPLFRYDFYLPDYNLIIEYHGRQHYEETKYFTQDLQEIQKHDMIKRQEAESNGITLITIPYTEYNNIDTILLSWLNDHPAGVGTFCAETDTIQCDEDMV